MLSSATSSQFHILYKTPKNISQQQNSKWVNTKINRNKISSKPEKYSRIPIAYKFMLRIMVVQLTKSIYLIRVMILISDGRVMILIPLTFLQLTSTIHPIFFVSLYFFHHIIYHIFFLYFFFFSLSLFPSTQYGVDIKKLRKINCPNIF